jgi:nucleoside-diphosphate-sugar epimerase
VARVRAARVLVAGAGDVGAAAGLALVARGDEVFGLRRDVRQLPAGLVPVTADLTRPETLRHLPQGLDALVFAASADRTDEDAYRAVYVDGLRHLLDAVGPVPRFVFTSTTGVYGQSDGSWVDEGSPTEPARFTGRVMLEAESIARDVARDAAAASTVLRLGGIYRPGRGRLLAQVRAGTAPVYDGPPVYTNRIHVADAAGAVVHVLGLAGAPPVLNVVDDDPADRRVVIEWLAEQLGAPAPPVESASARTRGDNKRVSNARLRATGYVLVHPTFRSGYAVS